MKKVDSSVKVDRHALQSKARDDRESNNSKPTTQAAGFLMRKPAKRCKAQPQQVSLVKQGCEAFCAEIRLDRLSHKQKASSLLYRKKPTRQRSER